jgi:excisionase family DNA binding protein
MAGQNTERLLLRVREAAEALGISRSATYRLIESGELESVRIGHARRIPVDAVADYVGRLRDQSGSHGATDAPPHTDAVAP